MMSRLLAKSDRSDANHVVHGKLDRRQMVSKLAKEIGHGRIVPPPPCEIMADRGRGLRHPGVDGHDQRQCNCQIIPRGGKRPRGRRRTIAPSGTKTLSKITV